jgi:V/A-type H+/Na+-transporting ATPase subunit E
MSEKGISAIENEVVGDVQKEAQAVISAAESEAKEILKIAKEKADQNYHEVITQAKVKAEAERRKIASVAEVEMRNRLLSSKEELVNAAFEKALVKIKVYVKTEQYHEYLLKLIESVAKKIGQKDLVIQVNAEDEGWLTEDSLKRLSKKLRMDIKMAKKPGDFIGGCIIQTADNKIIYDSTIDTRLQELKPTLRVEVSKMLFEKEEK